MMEATHRVVSWQPNWLIGGKVSQINPVPGGDQHILALDVAVTNVSLMALSYSMQQLESNPMLHHKISASILQPVHLRMLALMCQCKTAECKGTAGHM